MSSPKSQNGDVFSFKFGAYDVRGSSGWPLQAKTEPEACAEAAHWLEETYWNDDGSSAVKDPVTWTEFYKNGKKLGELELNPPKLSED